MRTESTHEARQAGSARRIRQTSQTRQTRSLPAPLQPARPSARAAAKPQRALADRSGEVPIFDADDGGDFDALDARLWRDVGFGERGFSGIGAEDFAPAWR